MFILDVEVLQYIIRVLVCQVFITSTLVVSLEHWDYLKTLIKLNFVFD